MTQPRISPNDRTAPLCAVSLIDRRTGLAHRVNGAPLLTLSREPQRIAAELLAGRDPALWDARIEVLDSTATTRQ